MWEVGRNREQQQEARSRGVLLGATADPVVHVDWGMELGMVVPARPAMEEALVQRKEAHALELAGTSVATVRGRFSSSGPVPSFYTQSPALLLVAGGSRTRTARKGRARSRGSSV